MSNQNFIVVMLDTLRADHVGAYGKEMAHTPNLDRFASTAMRFDKAYAASFPTIPNRTDLFTGRYGEPFHAWRPLSYMDVTLPEVMRKAGYATQLIHDTPHLINYGFGFDRPFNCWWMIRGAEVDRCWTDHHKYPLPCKRDRLGKMAETYAIQYFRNIRNTPESEDNRFCAKVMTASSRWLQDNYKNDNFFLWIDCFDPHEPWDPPKKYVDMYDPGYEGQALSLFFNKETIAPRELEHIRARYAAKVTMVDTWLGHLFTQIDQLGLSENTTVVVMSDHGTQLGDHGNITKAGPMYEEVGRLTWMMRAPGITKPGTSTDALAQPPDLMPTFLEIAELESDYTPQGKSLVPVLKGEDNKPRDFSISGVQRLYQGFAHTAVNDGEWTYIKGHEPIGAMLFNVLEDPMQTKNLSNECPEQFKRMHEGMIACYESMDTPDWLLECHKAGKIVCELPGLTPLELRMRDQMLSPNNFFAGEFEEYL
ncbi:sulfatase [Candidatus Hydrogenedentota bacterium]